MKHTCFCGSTSTCYPFVLDPQWQVLYHKVIVNLPGSSFFHFYLLETRHIQGENPGCHQRRKPPPLPCIYLHPLTQGKMGRAIFWEREREECFFLTVYHKNETHMFLWLDINMLSFCSRSTMAIIVSLIVSLMIGQRQ